jgi:hypothetical protein
MATVSGEGIRTVCVLEGSVRETSEERKKLVKPSSATSLRLLLVLGIDSMVVDIIEVRRCICSSKLAAKKDKD